MNRRAIIILFAGGFLAVMLAFAIAFFTFPVYRDVILGLLLILTGGLHLFTGILQIQRAKVQEELILWWKQPFIFSGLAFVCFGALFVTIQFIMNVIAGMVGLLLLLLTLGLFFYAILLWSQQRAQPNSLNNR